MSTRIHSHGVWLACAVTLLLNGCGSAPPGVALPDISPSSAAAAAMKQYDTNSDGRIEGEELEKAPSLKWIESGIDTNEDGALTESEIANRLRAWLNSKTGRMDVVCTVTMGKQPLKDATVKFIPEAFLGDGLKPGSGVTDEKGTARISIPLPEAERDYPGMPPGLYLVQITKQGVEIPEKYNSQTTLGVEVSSGAQQAKGLIMFAID